jgi:hypothetical protein
MTRRLLNLLTVLSLLLCVAAVVLWVRSLFVFDDSHFLVGDRSLGVGSFRGEISLSQVDAGPLAHHFTTEWRTTPVSKIDQSQERLSAQCQWRLLGVGVGRHVFWAGEPLKPLTNRVLILPYWLLAVVTSAPPAMRGIRLLRARRRVIHSLCPQCGYDLRATPERCPECGTPPAPTMS